MTRESGPRSVHRNPTDFAAGLAVLVAVCAIACAPEQHNVEPYQSDLAAAARLENRAMAACDVAPPTTEVRTVFVTDGCSMFPDGDWVECCVDHDIPYWCGGSALERLQADRALRACVTEGHPGALGFAMFIGVQIGGHPFWPAHWRWGYGTGWKAGYSR